MHACRSTLEDPTCVVSASKAGDANYEPATSAPLSITLNKASQSISFGTLAGKTYGDAPFSVGATSTSGLPVSFAAVAGSQCSVSGANVSLTGAGNCTILASQGGDASFFAAAAPVSQSFLIAKRTATATAGNAAINFGAAVPTIPCAVSGLLASDVGSVTCTTSVPAITVAGAYATTPIVSPAAPANYAVTIVSGVLNVAAYVQAGCFSSPIYSVMPDSKSAQKKGSNLPVKCTLTTPQGAAVLGAKGNLVVEDRGTNPATAPTATGTVIFSGTNVFSYSSGGNYSYGLDTGKPGFVAGHIYYVTATWSDGSKTQGWFILK